MSILQNTTDSPQVQGTPDNVPAIALGTTNPVPLTTAFKAAAPEPQQGMAQHIMSALGSSDGKIGDWAKAALAGGISQMAGEPAMPDQSKGTGLSDIPVKPRDVPDALGQFLKNRGERQQQQGQQKFENQVKLADLSLNEQRTRAQIATSTAELVKSNWELQHAKDLAPYQTEEAKINLQNAEDARAQVARNQRETIMEALTPEERKQFMAEDSEINSHEDITKDHVTQAAQGSLMPIKNPDGGTNLLPNAQNILQRKTKKPLEGISDYTVGKDGSLTPVMTTYPVGTYYGDIALGQEAALKVANQKVAAIKEEGEIAQKQAAIKASQAEVQERSAHTALLQKQAQDPDSLTPQDRFQVNKGNLKNIDELGTKGKDSYAVFSGINNNMRATIQAGAKGDMFATNLAKTMGVQTVNSIADLSRISPQEYSAMGDAGTYYQQMAAYLTKNVKPGGGLTQDQVNSLDGLAQRASDAKYRQYLTSVRSITENSYGDQESKFKNPSIINKAGNGTQKLSEAYGGYTKGEAAKVHQYNGDFTYNAAKGDEKLKSDDKQHWYDAQTGKLVFSDGLK